MNKDNDIRDRKDLSGEEILSLNFINDSGPYWFRKYYRSGLRSHIFEVLLAKDVLQEVNGIMEDGILVFPRARPKKVFRIFRSHFKTTAKIFHEIEKYNILIDILGPDLIALSEEFIVDYTGAKEHHMLLCGLQEYIEGEILDPWKIFSNTYLEELYDSLPRNNVTQAGFVQTARKDIEIFSTKIRQIIIEKGYIPDLAGIGNLILSHKGKLKLVDINNIVTINFEDTIPIDDKGYPSCDVSVHVLFILETRILQKNPHEDDPLYRFFLSPERKQKVKMLERQFYANL
ncbi:MAG: hypothetical protein ABIJ59_07625 [Pseudomonadota bacterium]